MRLGGRRRSGGHRSRVQSASQASARPDAGRVGDPATVADGGIAIRDLIAIPSPRSAGIAPRRTQLAPRDPPSRLAQSPSRCSRTQVRPATSGCRPPRTPCSAFGPHNMQLDPVGERVLIDRPGVRGAAAHGVGVGLARSPDVQLSDRRKGDKLDRVDLDHTEADPVIRRRGVGGGSSVCCPNRGQSALHDTRRPEPEAGGSWRRVDAVAGRCRSWSASCSS